MVVKIWVARTSNILFVVPLKFDQLLFESFVGLNDLPTDLNIVISFVIGHVPLLHQEHDHQACRSRYSKSTMNQYSVLMVTKGLEYEIEAFLKVSIYIFTFYIGDISIHVRNFRFKSVLDRSAGVYNMCNLKSVNNVIVQCLFLSSQIKLTKNDLTRKTVLIVYSLAKWARIVFEKDVRVFYYMNFSAAISPKHLFNILCKWCISIEYDYKMPFSCSPLVRPHE